MKQKHNLGAYFVNTQQCKEAREKCDHDGDINGCLQSELEGTFHNMKYHGILFGAAHAHFATIVNAIHACNVVADDCRH